jgi:PilZ domain
MAVSPAVSVLKKTSARAAFINVDGASAPVLRECFRQFGVEISSLKSDDAHRLRREKFDACVIGLDEKAETLLDIARTSPSNRRTVLFGICQKVSDTIQLSKYGINVLLEKPLDRQNTLRAVRAAHLLIINEFRRYVRVPIVVKMDAVCGAQHVPGNTVEVSGGGMSVRYKGKVSIQDEMQVAFDLPGQSAIKVRGIVCWVNPEDSMAGIRFEPTDQLGRELVRKWIDDYLDIV